MKPTFRAFQAISLGVFGLAHVAAAQTCEPGWEPGFTNPRGLTNEVRGVVFFDEGAGPRLFAAGHFGNEAGATIRGMARWNGEAWEPVGGGLTPVGGNTGAYTASVHNLGKGPALYVGGNFTQAGGQPAARIARWDGSSWSPLGSGVNDTVRMMTTHDDGTGAVLYVAGLFATAGGVQARGLAKWDGSAWTEVGGGLRMNGGAAGGAGYAVSVQDLGDGPKLYVGGWFQQQTAAGPAYNIARWDGAAWSGLGPGLYDGSNISPLVMVMRMYDHGSGPQLTVGGRFSMIPGGLSAPRVARWTGSHWVQVGSDLGKNDEYVNSLVEFDGPFGRTLYAGGAFKNASWLNNVNYVARLGGGDWAGLEGGMNNWTRAMVVHSDASGDRLLACGIFDRAGSAVAPSRVVEWDGERWNAICDRGIALSGSPRASLVFDGGQGERLFVGGDFEVAGNRVVNNIAAWDGERWEAVGEGVGFIGTGPDRGVFAMTSYADLGGPALYVSGQFSMAGRGPCVNIARWDGAQWSSLAGTGPHGPAKCLAVFDDGTCSALYVGGQFQQAEGFTCRGIARWNGTQWSPVGLGLAQVSSWSINALLPFDDGSGPRLYAGGSFGEHISGTGQWGLARWDGNIWERVGDARLLTGTGIVHAFATWNGALYAGGRFDRMSGAVATNIARLDGQAWVGLDTGLPHGPLTPVPGLDRGVFALAGTDRELWMGGYFSAVGPGGSASGMTRWDGGWNGFAAGTFPATARIATLGLWGDAHAKSMFAAGTFATVMGQPTSNIAEHRLCSCQPDCNADGALTTADFGCFQTRFALGASYADCNEDGALNLADFGCFQTKFAVGCP